MNLIAMSLPEFVFGFLVGLPVGAAIIAWIWVCSILTTDRYRGER